ncbi:PTS sugar transporter subunit IIC [Companilactobacillus sp.]|uniref:PTS sugar transporter subunit IIC n=1 Tax=Companilactobacillus sp. TaxID=2767905 RepID=UPI0025C5F147|nr:PTS transporter subunit EIIC [Companilactobacillus sp.]MCH4009725.1 PTS transporter subunit EIIC [Companilactobacillus sp.]MCH4052599.1 PTS transporter subunit EIIC [Companilactobacillus sp.]MCH4077667.1 PTS transporter subunit EIIC [Companilactobacillus sp.]MCH4126243.1 PTS transporter subunit EIIC [Companilactobacillus sp.]MCI1311951.1 PTS transporter subunit EIIC [Companilactobacillus sp.]
MDIFMNWMTDSFAPKVNKIARNPWMDSIQQAILSGMPLILIGSFATILGLIKDYVPTFPDFSLLNTFSLGLFSLFLAYLIPESVMKHKKHTEVSKQAGLAGIAFFLMLIFPKINAASGKITFDMSSLGTAGMIAALVSGLFVGFVMNLFANFKLVKEDSAIPDFVAVWFNTIFPMITILLVGWLFTFQLKINLSSVINAAFSPLTALGQSFWGLLILTFLSFGFLYSFGISTWVLTPIMYAIELPAMAQNHAAFVAGRPAANVFTVEAVALTLIGGGGLTLSLCLMLAFMAKSERLRIIGKASLVPAIFNINEPLVFGAPVAFNPILMIPMWINTLVAPILLWLTMKTNLVPIPHSPFQLWYTPSPIMGWVVTKSVMGLLFVLILFAISWAIYYPFFKVYDRQAVEQDASLAGEE